MASILESLKKVFSTGHKGVVLGIDIGSSSIKVVALEKIEEKVVLRNYAEISLGPRAGFASGQATNLPAEKVAEALHDLLKEAGIVAHHTLVAIPFSASLLTVAELPDVEKKELESMIPIEARRYIPVPITEVSIDWWVLPKRKAEISTAAALPPSAVKQVGKIEVIIAAIHNEIIKNTNQLSATHRFLEKHHIFEIEIFSTLRAVVGAIFHRFSLSTLVQEVQSHALVDEGRARCMYSMGGQDITVALSLSTTSFEKAEEIKCRVGILVTKGRDVLMVAEVFSSQTLW